jgi:hypothetical protein
VRCDATGRNQIMADWMSLKWLLWISLYLVLGVLVPWATSLTWAHQHRSDLRPHPRQLFQRGELGLVGLVLVISVIWDLLQSQYMAQTRALGSVLLAVIGTMAGTVWIETYCRQSTGTVCRPERTWRDSRNLAFLVFSMVVVVEILLDRFAKVAAL